MKRKSTLKKWPIWFNYGLFWSWNIIFTFVAVFVVIPYITLPLTSNAIDGVSMWSQAIYSLILVAVPFFAMGWAGLKIKKQPKMLMKLFYGVEMPIMFLMVMRILLLRDMNPGLLHLLINFAIAILAYFLLTLLFSQSDRKNNNLFYSISILILASVMLMFGFYLMMLLAPLLLPAICMLFKMLFAGIVVFFKVLLNPIIILLMILFAYTFGVFISLPVVAAKLYCSCFLRHWRLLSEERHLNKRYTVTVVALTVCLNSLLFIYLNQQPQQVIFQELAVLGGGPSLSVKQKKALLKNEDIIRNGLVNAYLGAYRYVSTPTKSNIVTEAYDEAFLAGDTDLANYSQKWFNLLALPFLYDGNDFREDKQKAEDLYQQFFDLPIEKREHDAILTAIQTTWEREEMAAGLINRLNRHVRLISQAIHIKPSGDIAEINIRQRFENQTSNNHEIVMHFALPDDAVLTGLWLSDDENNPRKYPAVVAPRGAAQQVYNDEVKRRIDPSILEQVGPRQYRLRAFPALPRRCRLETVFLFADERCKSQPLLVEIAYITPANKQGKWPLPQLLDNRNMYWDDSLQITVNDQWVDSGSHGLPETVTLNSNETKKKAHIAVIDDTYLLAEPIKDEFNFEAEQTKRLNMGILVDSSKSMQQQQDAIIQTSTWLQEKGIQHTFYQCNNGCKILTADKNSFNFFGNIQPLQQLSQWQKEVKLNQYNALIMLTDEGSYELESSANTDHFSNIPLWLVHLNGKLPYAYHDDMLALLRKNQGGTTVTLREAIYKLILKQNASSDRYLSDNKRLILITDHYKWYILPQKGSFQVNEKGPFTRIASRQWLNYLSQIHDISKPEILDKLHSIAVEQHIVTDYSSMLALVNERQKRLLKEAEGKEDRFDREVETGQEDITSPMDMFSVQTVPEPEEWLLIGLVIGMLCVVYYRRKRCNEYTVIGV
ncbi:TIGR02921 family PEP-CTERM protein [Zooshikella harenae]|uniref:TIGR02921 family PEP-CTERM protein n=1 Tax=Zooshikella harenae TaxID=2827238 RepID=A0ABS5ZIR7_9GAMM|nr:TIGR02921 family PEP-CTERM protein [Zooshikella harenae]MBU2713688.1 TIGR02921 family PEP-CTERM protein [Zooshikella harenae]